MLPNPTWSKSFLPGHAYPMSESSWRLCVHHWISYYGIWYWDGFQRLSTYYQVHVGSYGHIPSCQELSAAASQGPSAGNDYSLLKSPGVLTGRPCLAPDQGGRRDGQTGGEILTAHVYRKVEE
jgi:hypothetical protein